MKRKELDATAELERVLEGRPPRPPHETPPRMVNDISHLFFAKIRTMEPGGALSQRSAREVLRLLSREDGMKQAALARAAHMSAPTVSATLGRMEEEGLILRRQSEQDGRAYGVYLTDAGRAAHAAMREMLHGLDDVLMKGFDEKETELLSAMLDRMRQNLLESIRERGEETE